MSCFFNQGKNNMIWFKAFSCHTAGFSVQSYVVAKAGRSGVATTNHSGKWNKS